jgi:SNF2 family DNA or RNA helicase
MVINYDLPWNPQRVEQRIGRCHRYGQKYDVVVVNFINSQNAADQRVFQLLNEKFHLFDGVFGASDEVLGTVESGVDFEKKIVDIYQKCRTTEEINQSFDNLQRELEQQIQSKMKSAKEKLMENFDAEVIEKLKVRLEESKHYLNQIEERLWWITKYFLKDHAVFSDEKLQFELKNNPFSSKIPLGNYTMAKEDNHSIRYRINHPLAKGITKRIRNKNTPFSKLTFNLSNHPVKINSLEEYKGKKGIMRLTLVEVHSLDVTEHLIFSAISKEGYRLDNELCQRMFNVEGYTEDSSISEASLESLDDLEEQNISKLTLDLKQKDDEYFNFEVQKLNRWADDRIYMAEKELRDTKKRIRELNSKAKEEKDSSEQLEIQKKLQKLNSKQRKQRQEIFDIEDKIEEQRDQMIDEIEKRIQRDIKKKEIFTISWEII